jgi:uncharacterized protein YuzE
VIGEGLIRDDLLVEAFDLGEVVGLEIWSSLVGRAAWSHISTFYHYIIK